MSSYADRAVKPIDFLIITLIVLSLLRLGCLSSSSVLHSLCFAIIYLPLLILSPFYYYFHHHLFLLLLFSFYLDVRARFCVCVCECVYFLSAGEMAC